MYISYFILAVIIVLLIYSIHRSESLAQSLNEVSHSRYVNLSNKIHYVTEDLEQCNDKLREMEEKLDKLDLDVFDGNFESKFNALLYHVIQTHQKMSGIYTDVAKIEHNVRSLAYNIANEIEDAGKTHTIDPLGDEEAWNYNRFREREGALNYISIRDKGWDDTDKLNEILEKDYKQ
ncbi:hypothetical protein [Kluyvera genomosp. 3]|uniref:Uncharacterized protein n=1 Tax=Kluyvera genomosp. 3 TaxID=2774055 RepID=A0A6G9RPM8_9ENTR|nr:hypothetical protein [Kluyvera genomosp. 3]QIR27731.1 hypothetical protein GY169_13365 [Kluyvera genomosp. 3]